MNKNMKDFIGKNKLYLGIGIIALVLIVVIAIFSIQKEENVYTIGTILPLTGAQAHLGNSWKNGMELGVEEINNGGGINGKNLKLVVQDGKMDGKESITAVEYLLSIENPDIFTVIFEPPAQAISPILKEVKKPMVYESFGYTILESNPYAFKSNFDPIEGCKKLVEYAKENKKYKKLGVISANAEWTTRCIEGIKKVEPNIAIYLYNYGENDFRTYFIKAYNDGVDTIVTIPVFSPVNFFKQLSELGYQMTVLAATASEAIYPKVAESASNVTLNRVIGADIIPIDLAQTDYAKKYREKHSNPDNVEYAYSAMGYEEIMYITQAMKKCKPSDSNCLTKELKKVKSYNSVLGSYGFENRVLQFDIKLYRYNNGEWQPVD